MWIVTSDWLDDEETSRIGVHSRDYDAEKFATLSKIQVRLLDADGEVYYRATASRERILESDGERAFELLDWAEADAGCTELQYFDGGAWHTL